MEASQQLDGFRRHGLVGWVHRSRALAGVNHGLLDQGTLITLDVPGSTSTQAFGLNNDGQVVGAFIDNATKMHGFVFQHGHFVTIDDPNGIGTTTVNESTTPVRSSGSTSSGNRPVSGGERSRLDEVISDVASALPDGLGMEPRDRVGDAGV
jgi:probable HAF family extracellular repeat protein